MHRGLAAGCVLAWLMLLAGCQGFSFSGDPQPPAPGDAEFASRGGQRGAEFADSGWQQSRVAGQVRRLAREGDFDQAHKLIDEQAGRTIDPIDVLWWQCQELHVLLLEGRTNDRKALAGRLANAPAARQPRFCLSSGWDELVAACLETRQADAARQLLADRHQALLACREDTPHWRSQMTQLCGDAQRLGDLAMARQIGSELSASGGSPAPPPANPPDRTVMPRR